MFEELKSKLRKRVDDARKKRSYEMMQRKNEIDEKTQFKSKEIEKELRQRNSQDCNGEIRFEMIKRCDERNQEINATCQTEIQRTQETNRSLKMQRKKERK